MKNVASSIKLAKSMEYIFFQDIINIDDDVIEVIVVISSIIKWIANTKKKKNNNNTVTNISSVLVIFNILKTSQSKKSLFAKFVKTGHP